MYYSQCRKNAKLANCDTFYANIVFEGVFEDDFSIYQIVFSHESASFILFNVAAVKSKISEDQN